MSMGEKPWDTLVPATESPPPECGGGVSAGETQQCGGINFIDKGDPAYDANQAYTSSEYFVIHAHGFEKDPTHVTTRVSGGTKLTVQEVGNAVLRSSWNRRQTIQAMICYGTLGGQNSFDNQLAIYLSLNTGEPVSFIGSSSLTYAERYHIGDFYFGGPSGGPSGWQTTTVNPPRPVWMTDQ
jgi:hypothetical protein